MPHAEEATKVSVCGALPTPHRGRHITEHTTLPHTSGPPYGRHFLQILGECPLSSCPVQNVLQLYSCTNYTATVSVAWTHRCFHQPPPPHHHTTAHPGSGDWDFFFPTTPQKSRRMRRLTNDCKHTHTQILSFHSLSGYQGQSMNPGTQLQHLYTYNSAFLRW